MAKIKPGKDSTKKDVILMKASLLFRTRGFNAASMRQLAEMVGVEAPSLYNHIGSKIELLQEICFKMAAEFTAHLDVIEKMPVTSSAKIDQIIRFHICMMLNKFDQVFVADHEWMHLKEPYLNQFLNKRRVYEKRLVTLIEEGIRTKEFRKSNPYVMVLTLLSAVRGIEFWQRQRKNVTPQVLEDDMAGHLLKGMLK